MRDAASAAERTDLPFLRRRSRPKPARPIDYTHHRSEAPAAAARPSPPPPSTPPPATPSPSTPAARIDYRHRDQTGGGSSSLDLSGPSPTTPAATTPASSGGGSSSLDLSGPPTRPSQPAPASASASLDLSRGPSAATPSPAASPAQASRPVASALPVRAGRRVSGREQVLLNIRNPTVTMTRVQSGVGELVAEAVCSAEIGDLRLGALYQLRSGGSSTVQPAGGHRFGPPPARRPVLVGGREEYERIAVDLRQVGDIERVAFYAFSESRQELTWGGTLVIATFGGGRIELPLETLYAGRIAVLASLYNLDGELVVRAELETIAGDVREAARAYGYDRITWRDDRNPVD